MISSQSFRGHYAKATEFALWLGCASVRYRTQPKPSSTHGANQMAHEEIVELSRQIAAEDDSRKLIPLIDKLRKVLAKEKARIEAELEKRNKI
jgi:hypothetical protein